MGLDICFDREKAIAAGLRTRKLSRATESEITQAIEDGESKCYIDFLREEVEYVVIPRTHSLVGNDGTNCFSVRANKWGSSYGPLTEWLKENQIDWVEA